ncbi:MAG: ABC transporter permease [Ilumatobacteraceae bacterium]
MEQQPTPRTGPRAVDGAAQSDDLVVGEETVSTAAVLATDPADIEASMVPPKQSPMWRRLGVQFWVCVVWIVVIGIAGLAAGILPLTDPRESDFTALAEGPSWRYWMGTDDLGRDIFSRVVHGTRVSITVGVFAVLIGLIIGGLLGLIAGYYRRRTESVIMTFADSLVAFPALVLLLTLTTFLGQTLQNIVLAIGIVTIPIFIRLARANTLTFAQREFVLAAKATGSRNLRIITREVLPNVAMPLMAFSLVVVAVAIVAEGSLSFLGLSVPPTTPTWGNIIAGGRQSLEDAPHIVFFPSLVMFLTVISFNLAGDRLREVLEVKEGAL